MFFVTQEVHLHHMEKFTYPLVVMAFIFLVLICWMMSPDTKAIYVPFLLLAKLLLNETA